MRIIVLVCMLSFLVFGCAQRTVVSPDTDTTTKEEAAKEAMKEAEVEAAAVAAAAAAAAATVAANEEVITEDAMMDQKDVTHVPESGMVKEAMKEAMMAGTAGSMAVSSLFSVAPDGTKFTNVYFDFDKYQIKDEFRPILMRLSDWLIDNHAVMLIGGHCDERGTNEYNLALGDRRARSVMDFLLASGVPSRKLEAISHGEEKPTCDDSKEACWWKNRRAQFSFGMK
jgi:peptidoglycan-associated lipoprotein